MQNTNSQLSEINFAKRHTPVNWSKKCMGMGGEKILMALDLLMRWGVALVYTYCSMISLSETHLVNLVQKNKSATRS
jgi:hypothetical protein